MKKTVSTVFVWFYFVLNFYTLFFIQENPCLQKSISFYHYTQKDIKKKEYLSQKQEYFVIPQKIRG